MENRNSTTDTDGCIEDIDAIAPEDESSPTPGQDSQTVDEEPKPKSIAERMMAKMGYKEGEGLGKSGEGIKEPVTVEPRDYRLGLGATEDHNGSQRWNNCEKAPLRTTYPVANASTWNGHSSFSSINHSFSNSGPSGQRKAGEGWSSHWHPGFQSWLFFNNETETWTPHNPHAPSSSNDGWEFKWDPHFSRYSYYNRKQNTWTWENPRV